MGIWVSLELTPSELDEAIEDLERLGYPGERALGASVVYEALIAARVRQRLRSPAPTATERASA